MRLQIPKLAGVCCTTTPCLVWKLPYPQLERINLSELYVHLLIFPSILSDNAPALPFHAFFDLQNATSLLCHGR